MKKYLALILAALMLFSLAACGGTSDGGKKADDGKIVITLGDYEAVYTGCQLMTDDDGDDAIGISFEYTNNSKEAAAFAWNMFFLLKQDGEELEMATVCVDGEDWVYYTDGNYEDVEAGDTKDVMLTYKLKNLEDDVTLDCYDFGQKNKDSFTIELSTAKTNSSGDSLLAPDKTAEGTDEPVETLTEIQQWWNGDWYGWWIMSSTDGYYEENGMEGFYWDCCAEIDVDDTGSGSIIIWDKYFPKSNALAEFGLSVSDNYGGGMSGAINEAGYFLDMQLEHADLSSITPGLVDYENFIVIEGWYEDDAGEFYLEMFLRPWGQLWDDVSGTDHTMPYTEMLPYYYYDWYLPAIEANAAMPDEVCGDYVPGSAGSTAPSGGAAGGSLSNASMSGPTDTYTIYDAIAVTYPTDTFAIDETAIWDTIAAKDGSVSISMVVRFDYDDFDAMNERYDGYSEYDQYSSTDFSVGDYAGRMVSYYDDFMECYYAEYYVDFNGTGGDHYNGISFTASSEKSLEACTSDAVMAIVNTAAYVG